MRTLIIVDTQNDFMPGGSLEVPDGDKIVSVINDLQKNFDLVLATQDWHPADHSSFASNHENKEPFQTITWKGNNQMLWPDHCIQGTVGAEFHKGLEMNRVEAIFRKGMDVNIDSYSGFYDNNHEKNTGLSGYLKERGVKDLCFCGLAADVCVQFSIRDAIKEGFSATLIEDGTKAINDEDFAEIKNELNEMGCKMIESTALAN